MTVIDPRRLLNAAIWTMQKEGLVSLIKQVFSNLITNLDVYIFKKDLDLVNEYKPKIKDFTLEIISFDDQLFDLIEDGFKIVLDLNIDELVHRIIRGEVLFCVFVGKNIAHRSWVAMNESGETDMPLKMNWEKEAYIQQCVTNPKYRGMGLYPYTLSKIFEFLREKGKSVAKIIVTKNNIPSIRGVMKAGFKVCSQARYIRLFFLVEFLREKDIV